MSGKYLLAIVAGTLIFAACGDDVTLVALTIMIAESRSEEKEMMVDVIVNCL